MLKLIYQGGAVVLMLLSTTAQLMRDSPAAMHFLCLAILFQLFAMDESK